MPQLQPGPLPWCRPWRHQPSAWISPRAKATQERGMGRADPSWQSLKLQHRRDHEIFQFLGHVTVRECPAWQCRTAISSLPLTALIPAASRNTRAYIHPLEINGTAAKQSLTPRANPPGKDDSLKHPQIHALWFTVSNNTWRNSLCWQIIRLLCALKSVSVLCILTASRAFMFLIKYSIKCINNAYQYGRNICFWGI